MGICLDLSHWDFPTAGTVEQFRELRARGVSDVIIGGNPNFPNEAPAQIQFARDAGIYVGALYTFQYFGLDIEQRWPTFNARVAERENIARVYIDCESEYYGPGDGRNTEAPNLTPENRIAEFWRVLHLLQGLHRESGVYTNAAWWRPKMKDSHAFAFLPLWLPHWLSADHFLPFETTGGGFGGWTENAIHQYTSSYPDLLRDRRDANHIHNQEVWYVDVLKTIETQGQEIDRLNRLVAGNGYGRTADGEIRLTGADALDAADADGASLFLGLGDVQADVAKLKDAESIFTTMVPAVADDAETN